MPRIVSPARDVELSPWLQFSREGFLFGQALGHCHLHVVEELVWAGIVVVRPLLQWSLLDIYVLLVFV